jgi:hypothetical protein
MHRIRRYSTMANIEIMVRPEGDLAILRVEGDLTADEILHYSSEFYDKNPKKLVLWDITRGSLSKVTSSDLKRTTREMKKYTGKIEGGKTALVGHLDVDFGLARMYVAYAEIADSANSYQAFRDIEDAITWLYSQTPWIPVSQFNTA